MKFPIFTELLDSLNGTKVPSIADPLKLKYHEIPFSLPLLQSSAGS